MTSNKQTTKSFESELKIKISHEFNLKHNKDHGKILVKSAQI